MNEKFNLLSAHLFIHLKIKGLIRKLRGGGVKGRAIKKKLFLEPFVPTFQRPLSSRGGGGLGLNGPAIKRRTFFAASLTIKEKCIRKAVK